MKTIFYISLMLFCFLIVGCQETETEETPKEDQPQQDTTGLTYLDLFDLNNTIKIDIFISSEELQKLNSDYTQYHQRGLKSPIYRRADKVTIVLTKEGTDYSFSYDDVGVRMKGNTSRTNFINDQNQIYNKIHLKLSFEETFDDPLYYNEEERMSWTDENKKAREDRNFLDMSKLDLRFNRLEDESHIKEYYALEMYRSFGILSQHSNFGEVTLHQDQKDIHYGLFLVTEPLTKTFIKRSLENESYLNMARWKDEKKGTCGVADSKYGQLYKASYGLGSTIMAPNMSSYEDRLFGVEPDDASFLPPYELKSNKDSNDNTLIKEMIKSLQMGSIKEIEEKIDLDYFTTYEAISTVLGGPDDLRNNYNNYAMYFRRTDGKMVLIPIDLDRVLGVSKGFDPSGMAMANISPFEKKAVGANQDQVNPLYSKVLVSEKYKKMYQNKLEEILESKWFKNDDYFNEIYQKVYSLYHHIQDDFQNVKWNLNEEYQPGNKNMSFSNYRTLKTECIKNALSGKESSILTGFTNFYLTGTMDQWNKTSECYHFSKLEDGIYALEYKIEELSFECKIYTTDGGGKWLRAENDEVLHEGGSNLIFNLDKAYLNKVLLLIVDTHTGKLHYEIK